MRQTILRKAPEIRRWVLLALVFLVPLFFLTNTLDTFNVPKMGLLIIGVALAASIKVVELLQGADPRPLARLAFPAAAVLVPLTIGWLFSPYKGWALFGPYPRLTGFVPYIVIVLYGVLLADAFGGRAEQIAWALVAAGGVAGAYALIQAMGLDPYDWQLSGEPAGMIASTLGNPNFAGAFFGITIPLGLTLCIGRSELRTRALASTLLAVGGCIVMRSEGGWLAAGGGSALAAGLIGSRHVSWFKWVGLLAAALAALVAVGVVLLALDEQIAEKLPPTAERRAEWWVAAAEMTRESPLVGRGPSVFGLEHPQHRTLEDGRRAGLTITNDPHSVFLSFATSAGILGAVGFLSIFGWCIWRAWSSALERPITAGFLGAVSAYFIQSLVSIDTVPLRSTLWVTLAGFAASLVGLPQIKRSATRRTRAVDRQQTIRALPAVAVVVIVGLVAVGWGANFILADRRMALGHRQLRADQFEDARTSFEKAIDFRGEIGYRRDYGRVLGSIAVALGENGAELLSETREVFAYIDDIPHVLSIRDLAVVLRDWALAGGDTSREAMDLYRRALRLDPLDLELLQEAAGAAIAMGRAGEAVSLLDPHAEELETSRVWGLLALAYMHLGNEDEAGNALDRALSLDPEEPNALKARDLLDE